ncbi:hypothetical protein GGD61_007183 [Bradyrhizobium sp. SBR1B]|nr:hypothetical protein [Bradyrhizobium sp. SBR1B]
MNRRVDKRLGNTGSIALDGFLDEDSLKNSSPTIPESSIVMNRTFLDARLCLSSATLMPLVDAIRSHVFATERLHADDATVPSWPRVSPGPASSGPTCATTVRLRAQIRRRPCSSTRPIVAVRIRSNIWRAMPD